MTTSAGKGYVYAELDVRDEEHFHGEYMPRVRPVLERYGAKFLIIGGNPRVIEGGRDVKRVVLLEFESPERVEEFYYSEDYQDVIGFRFDSADAHLYFLDGPSADGTGER